VTERAQFVATPIAVEEADISAIAFNSDGLVPAIVQEHGTGEVLMLGWMDDTALRRTLSSGRTWFWSRSRQEYWCKGETSGDRQWVRAAYYDCDGDTVLVVVEQEGRGACHTGERSCFFRAFGGGSPAGTPASRAVCPAWRGPAASDGSPRLRRPT
jgi:phosphoribosyl-AMP cyclohydrolase